MSGLVVDLFAGVGGWAEGLRLAGHEGTVVGLDTDADACATSSAAGHLVVRADVTSYPAEAFGGVDGLTASPPCQDWSQAGLQAGYAGDTGHLVDEPMRWIEALHPRWVAFEQVPRALAVWRQHAHTLRQWGYTAWTGKLCAADYGVPQTRTRAILIARRGGGACLPGDPTHCQNGPKVALDGTVLEPWVTMAEALDVPDSWAVDPIRGEGCIERHGDRPARGVERPAPTITAGFHKRNRWVDRNPSPTVTAGGTRTGGWEPFGPTTRAKLGDYADITPREAATLQGFPDDYPWRGGKESRGRQAGNAIPPALAAAAVTRLVEPDD